MAKQKVQQKTQGSKSETGTVSKAASRMKRHEIVREKIIESHGQIETGYMDLCKLLAEAYHNDYHKQWGFDSFEEYCNKELDEKYRKARYLIDIYDKVKSLNLPEERVQNLGWSKMKDIAAVITEDNAKEWLEKAEKMTSREVTEAVKISRKRDTSQSKVPMVTTISLKMTEAEANIILEAIAEAKKVTESDNDVTALELICQDWMEQQEASPTRSSIEDRIAYLEEMYGVTITYETPEPSETEDAADEVLKKAEKNGKKVEEEDEDLEDILGLEDDD